MSEVDYSREAFRKMREQRAAARQPECQEQPSLLEQIPADAPMDEATISAWNGERFVAYEEWLARRPVVTEDKQESSKEKNDTKCARAKAPEQERLWE